jgi:sugar phosphate isomerase/epimerase
MRIQLGLKAWSTNNLLIYEAKEAFHRGVLDYVEVFAVPGSYGSTWQSWAASGLPCVIHAPHSAAGLNFSLKEMESANKGLARESLRFADALKSDKVIFHSGTRGTIDETIRQMRLVHDSRMIIENKPFRGLDGSDCVGSTPAEIKKAMEALGIRFCLDFGHAIAASISFGQPWKKLVSQFMELKPVMFHLTDGDMSSELDHHDQYGMGSFPLSEIIKFLPSGALVTNEAKRENMDSVKEYIEDRRRIESLLDNGRPSC